MTLTLSKTLLYLYECLSEPKHTELMIETIGAWLSEDDNVLQVTDLEEHSQNVLKLLENQIGISASEDVATSSDLSVPDNRDITATLGAINVSIGGVLDAKETAKLSQFLDGDAAHTLFQYTLPSGTQQLCLITRKKKNLHLWFNEHQLDSAVETLLKQDLSLSNSEFLVLREIARGGKATQIAQRLGKSPETIKSQLKSIATKLGSSGQQQIQAQVARLEKFVAQAGIKQPPQQQPKDSKLVLPDGRTLAYSIYGPKTGRPILFFHCFLHGRHLPKDIDGYLQRNNMRIISMSRAGFGGSTLVEGHETDRLKQNSADYAALAHYLNLGPMELFSHLTGFASALHFALSYPELSRGLTGLDAVPPANSRERIRNLIGLFKSTSLAMSKAPATFNLMTRFVFNRLSSFQDPNKKMRRHILYPSIPLEELETAAGLDAATANVRDLMQNQLRQCVQEARTFRKDWADVSSDINTKPRVKLFHTRDNPFVSVSGATDLAQTMGCRVEELDETFPFLTPHMDALFTDSEKPHD